MMQCRVTSNTAPPHHSKSASPIHRITARQQHRPSTGAVRVYWEWHASPTRSRGSPSSSPETSPTSSARTSPSPSAHRGRRLPCSPITRQRACVPLQTCGPGGPRDRQDRRRQSGNGLCGIPGRERFEGHHHRGTSGLRPRIGLDDRPKSGNLKRNSKKLPKMTEMRRQMRRGECAAERTGHARRV